MENNITYFTDSVDKTEYDKIVAERDNLKQMLEHSRNANVGLNNRIESFKQEIKDFVVNNLGGHVDDDDLRELAENFSVELTQQISFSVSAVFHCTATVPLNADLDDLENLLDGEFSMSIDYNGSEIEDFDWELPDTEVNDVEVL